MPLMQFLPWLQLDAGVRFGQVEFVPCQRDQPTEGIDPLTEARLRLMLRQYRGVTGVPVTGYTIVRYGSREPFADLSSPEMNECATAAEMVAFAALAARTFCTTLHDNTDCNYASFERVAFEFKGDATTVQQRSRRRMGGHVTFVPIADRIVSAPPQLAHGVIKCEEPLLRGLEAYMQSASELFDQLEEAIISFNAANTDREGEMTQVEWTLLCAAFERALKAKSNGVDVAARFDRCLSCPRRVAPSASRRWKSDWRQTDALSSHWMREFYFLRGDFAHGRLATARQRQWSEPEHLLVATIAFPLVVRQILARTGCCQLCDAARAQVNIFEEHLDCAMGTPVDDPYVGKRMPWERMLLDERQRVRSDSLFEKLSKAASSSGGS